MSKKHFEAIARIIKTELETTRSFWNDAAAGYDAGYAAGAEFGIERTAKNLADEFGKFNPNFDRQRFLTACGVEA